METWKGASPQDVVAGFDNPYRQSLSPEGNLVYEYRHNGTAYYDNMILPLECDRSFEFRNDAMIRWKWSGNYCAVISRK
jgi:hypothetical protein